MVDAQRKAPQIARPFGWRIVLARAARRSKAGKTRVPRCSAAPSTIGIHFTTTHHSSEEGLYGAAQVKFFASSMLPDPLYLATCG